MHLHSYLCSLAKLCVPPRECALINWVWSKTHWNLVLPLTSYYIHHKRFQGNAIFVSKCKSFVRKRKVSQGNAAVQQENAKAFKYNFSSHIIFLLPSLYPLCNNSPCFLLQNPLALILKYNQICHLIYMTSTEIKCFHCMKT